MPINNEILLNELIINPAIAGINTNTNISLLSRLQWLGVEDAPRSQCFSFDTRIKTNKKYNHTGEMDSRSRIPRSGRVGLGGFVFNDINEPFRRTGVNFAYAYHLKKGKYLQHNLSFGFGTSFFLFSVDNTEFVATDMNDPAISAKTNLFIPNLSLGLKYNYQNLYLGASAVHFIPIETQFSDIKNEIEKNRNQLFVHAGMNLKEGQKITIMPSILYRTITNQFDANLGIKAAERYTLSVSYHSTKSVSAIAGLRINKIGIYYSYQFSTAKLENYKNSSQMIMINYEL